MHVDVCIYSTCPFLFVFVFDCHDFVVADVDNAQCCLLANSYGVQRYISQSAAARLVAAMVISHLDYFNSIFTGPPADQIARLQQLQNNAAWLVMKTRRRDHPLLKELHWLPIKFHCQYKIATLAYHHFEGSLPPHLFSSLRTCEPSRSLRSSNENLLKIPKRKLDSFGQRSFGFRRWMTNIETSQCGLPLPLFTCLQQASF